MISYVHICNKKQRQTYTKHNNTLSVFICKIMHQMM